MTTLRYCLQSCEVSQMWLFISIQPILEPKFHWLWIAWSICLYLFLDSRKTGERRGSTGVSANIWFSLWNSSYDSQSGTVITFLECVNNKTTLVIRLKMYKKALTFRKVNVQVSFPLEANINSEEQEKIEKNEPCYCKSTGSLSCNSRHCCKSWNIKSHWVERWMQTEGNLEGNKIELMKVCSLSSM